MRRVGRGPLGLDSERDRPPDFWLSYSDLMAGLLMVFALMLLVALYHYQSGVQGVAEILVVRDEMAREIKEALEAPGRIVEVDSAGTIRFKDSLLFSQASSTISDDGRRQLAAFANLYLPLLLGNPRFRGQLQAIVIEGHTNDDGSYAYNLDLSQKRAFSVMQVLLAEAGEYEEDLKTLVTANGRSFADLIYAEGTDSVDKERSRRIEIRFRLQDDVMLREVQRRVFGVTP